MRLRPSSYGHATAHGQRDDPVVEMSSKKIACGGSCKESHLGIFGAILDTGENTVVL
jgi:hypothetical protein